MIPVWTDKGKEAQEGRGVGETEEKSPRSPPSSRGSSGWKALDSTPSQFQRQPEPVNLSKIKYI